jgi:hypothetical protein
MPLARNSATAGDTLNGLAAHFETTHARRTNKFAFSFASATTSTVSAKVSALALTRMHN